jgi:protein-S-isoprenylcysteine O-methyltransferase Ste14
MQANRVVMTTPEIRRSVRMWLRKQITFLLILPVVLFVPAGTFDWPMAWVQIALYVLVFLVSATLLVRRDPSLIAERAQVQEGTVRWDLFLTSLAAVVFPLLTWIVAGLDRRWGWTSPVPPLVLWGAVLLWLMSYSLILWAMASNTFFSATVRIQKERGHQVARTGPYALIRHPGYTGAILNQLATPLMLGSLWALLPSALAALLFVVRTAVEDRFLQRELEGYREYVEQVQFRLIPGLW